MSQWHTFNDRRISMGLSMRNIEEVLGTQASMVEIDRWIEAVPGRTTERLLMMARERKLGAAR
jgi:hypothetical protein